MININYLYKYDRFPIIFKLKVEEFVFFYLEKDGRRRNKKAKDAKG